MWNNHARKMIYKSWLFHIYVGLQEDMEKLRIFLRIVSMGVLRRREKVWRGTCSRSPFRVLCGSVWILGHLGSTQGESRHGTEKTIRFKERSVEFRPIMWNWVVWKFGSRNLNGWADSCRDKPFVAPCGTAFLGWGLGRWQEMTTAWNAVHRFQDNQKQLGRQQVRSSSKQRMAGYLWTTCWSLQMLPVPPNITILKGRSWYSIGWNGVANFPDKPHVIIND